MRTLIAFSTRHGATRKNAEALARELSDSATIVDLRKEPGIDVTPFDTVVVGTAIYAGQAQKEVGEFCARNRDALGARKLGLFICCWSDGEQAQQALQAAFPGELLESARVKGALGGEMNLTDMSFFERLIVRMIVKVKENASRFSQEAVEKFASQLK